MVVLAQLAMVATVVSLMTLPITFQPKTNDNFSNVNVRLAPGSTLAETEAVADRAAAIIEADPDVDRVFEWIYVSSSYLNVVLKRDRKRPSFTIERELAPKLAAIPDAQVTVLANGMGGPGGASQIIPLGALPDDDMPPNGAGGGGNGGSAGGGSGNGGSGGGGTGGTPPPGGVPNGSGGSNGGGGPASGPNGGLTTAIPEPAAWMTLITGFGLMGALLRRRRAIAAG